MYGPRRAGTVHRHPLIRVQDCDPRDPAPWCVFFVGILLRIAFILTLHRTLVLLLFALWFGPCPPWIPTTFLLNRQRAGYHVILFKAHTAHTSAYIPSSAKMQRGCGSTSTTQRSTPASILRLRKDLWKPHSSLCCASALYSILSLTLIHNFHDENLVYPISMAVSLLWVCVSEPLNVSFDLRPLPHVAGSCTG